MKKYQIQYKTVFFIEKAISYTFELPKNQKEEDFMKKNELLVNKYIKRYPRINYDPIGAYQYACNLFSEYTTEEKQLIWNSNSDMAEDNANITWKLLKAANEEPVGIYFTKHFFYRIKIFFQQVKFFISTRFNLIIYNIKKKLGIKNKKDEKITEDLLK